MSWVAAGSGVPDAPQQPRSRGRRTPGRPRRLRRNWPSGSQLGRLRRDGTHADDARRRRDDARPVRQAGRRVPHPRVGAARAARQLQPCSGVGQLGRVPPARSTRSHDVRPDDGRLVDLHRHPRHPAGHLRVLRRDRPSQVRRIVGGHDHADRGAGRDGWSAAARGHDERRGRALHRGRSLARRAPGRDPLPRRDRRLHRGRDRPLRARPRRAPGTVSRPRRQCCSAGAAAARSRLPGRHRHRPDECSRPALVRAGRPHAGGHRHARGAPILRS